MKVLYVYSFLSLSFAFLAVFAAFPKSAAAQDTLSSAILGVIIKGPYEQWSGNTIAVPFYNNEAAKVMYNFNPEEDPAFLAEADKALANFLTLDDKAKLSLSSRVSEFAKICLDSWDYQNYSITAAGSWMGLRDLSITAAWLDEFVAGTKQPDEVWRMVGNINEIFVVRNVGGDNKIYIVASWHCLWEEEHGLQLTFKEGKELMRVSIADSELTD